LQYILIYYASNFYSNQVERTLKDIVIALVEGCTDVTAFVNKQVTTYRDSRVQQTCSMLHLSLLLLV